MDNRTYSSVLSRFANGLLLTDPLQTLYQLMSGRQPAAVTCVGEEKWGDWRPHLAMMLSNTSNRPDLDKKSILTMGDSLLNKNLIYAAQFCYLMGQLDWANYGKHAKLVLLTGNAQLPFKCFATNEAIQCTEVYEFARQLATPEYHIPHFQWYKYLYACRLLDMGMATEAMHYCEVLSRALCAHPSAHPASLATQVYTLASGLKHLDPVFQEQEGQEGSLQEPQWLQDLALLMEQQRAGLVNMETPSFGSTSNLTSSETGDTPSKETLNFGSTNVLQSTVTPHPNLVTPLQEPPVASTPQTDQQASWQHYDVNSMGAESQYPSYNSYQQQPEQQQWGADQQQSQSTSQSMGYDANQQYWGANNQWNSQVSGVAEPVTSPYWGDNSMQTSTTTPYEAEDYNNSPRSDYGSDLRQERNAEPERDEKPTKDNANKENKSKKPSSADNNAQSGWFGGLFNKFSLKPKNQMKLPDDKKPKIVYDEAKKRWVNLDEDEDESNAAPPAPPKDTELMKPPQQRAPVGNVGTNLPTATAANPTGPPPAAGGNLYKLPKGRALRPSYVDVLNPGGTSVSSKAVNGPMTTPLNEPPVPSFFVPPPAPLDQPSSLDFITPAAPSTTPGPASDDVGQQHQEPVMFNPSQFANTGPSPTAGPGPRRRYPH